MQLETFLALPTHEVAQLVEERGPRVCVFPINGTRRWFLLEHPAANAEEGLRAYLTAIWERQIELYRLFFEHGIRTLVTPIFGSELLTRDPAYLRILEPGLAWLVDNEELHRFYAEHRVRARVYGDVERRLKGTPFSHLVDGFRSLPLSGAPDACHTLFFGVCAEDATEAVAEIAVQFHARHGRLPTKAEIIEAYYGEPVGPVDLFIGYDRPAVFDMPLISTGEEDLYFTVAPSPFLDAQTLRTILYDHLFSRRVGETYGELSPSARRYMEEYYAANRRAVLGIGTRSDDGACWYPSPQVVLP